MTTVRLLDDLRATGVLVTVEGGKLKIRAPRDVLTQELLSRLKNQKAELLRLLNSETPNSDDSIDRTRSEYSDRVNSVISVIKTGDNSTRTEKPCNICQGTRFWRHTEPDHWLCSRCHPPAAPDVVVEEHEIQVDPIPQADWGPGGELLVTWFLEEGQYRIPAEPFMLTSWIKVTNPEKFRESIKFDISCGPAGPRNRYGAAVEDLRRLHDLLTGEIENEDRE